MKNKRLPHIRNTTNQHFHILSNSSTCSIAYADHKNMNAWNKTVWHLTLRIAQSAGAIDYTDCISAEG